MEALVKKYQQKFRRVKQEMGQWDELNSRLLSQFSAASAIIQRLQVIQDPKNFASLKCVEGIQDAVLVKQMESLTVIFASMTKTMEDFNGVVRSLGKLSHDGVQLVQGGSSLSKSKQLQQRIGAKPSIVECIQGLRVLHEMHESEYRLKLSIVSALEGVCLKPSASDCLGGLHQLLVDQPNIPKEEVETIFNIIFAEESS